MSDESGKRKSENPSGDEGGKGKKHADRRSFMKTAAATAAGAMLGLSGKSAMAAGGSSIANPATGGGPLPGNTPITKLLSSENAKLLTANAAKMTKDDLLNLRTGQVYKLADANKGPQMSLTVTDLDSIEEAFDSQYGTTPKAYAMRAKAPKGSADGSSCCCCCSTAPCCCCTAAAQTGPMAGAL